MKPITITTLIATSLTTASVIGFSGTAEAAILQGSITINGNMTISRINTSTVFVDFKDVDGILATGDFASFVPNLAPIGDNNVLGTTGWDDPADGVGGAIINIKDLTLTSPSYGGLPANYKTPAVASFLNFGTRTLNGSSGTLTFDLNATDFVVGFSGTQVTGDVSFPYASGVWKFNGDTVAVGAISGTVAGSTQSYTISLASEPVPEPLTILGSALALGFGAAFRRKKEQG